VVILLVLSLLTAVASGTPFSDATETNRSSTGTWVGYGDLNGKEVPFHLELRGVGDSVVGTLVNGRERYVSSSGSLFEGHLVLHFDYYANTLDAKMTGGVLNGTFSGRSRSITLTAHLSGEAPKPAAGAPNIAGDWVIAVQGPKGEHKWSLHVRQNGARVVGVIQRIDGDTGSLYGHWDGNLFPVSHFTAAGPSYAELKPEPDGTLQIVTFAHNDELQTHTAHRTQAQVQNRPESVDDPSQHTFLKTPTEPLPFHFPDLTGRLVSNTDAEFKGKVVIVSIGGSWCPNCQDEAPFLEDLYRRFHGQGLDVVEVSFEEGSQHSSPSRLKAVIHRYGLTFPVLLAGTPDQLNEKFPTVSNLNCWPTTFFIGRDGAVKAIHTGYSGPATGKKNSELQNDTVSLVSRLLSQQLSLSSSR